MRLSESWPDLLASASKHVMSSGSSADRPRSRSPTSIVTSLFVSSSAEKLIREVSSSAGSGKLAWPTGLMVTSQVVFLIIPYMHAYHREELSPQSFHISAVLDDDFRSSACAVVGMFGLTALMFLEHSRGLPRRALRLVLAAVTGAGIIAVSLVRESYYVNQHRLLAAVAFGGAVALVWVVAALAKARRGLVAAYSLIVLVVLTGSAQGLNILADSYAFGRPLPSWALGSLELVMISGFAGCMCANAAAGGAKLIR